MINLLASVQHTSMVTAILAAILGVVAVVFFVLLGFLLMRDKAEKTRLDKDVYKREFVSNKELREQKREKKKQDGDNKPRHGKKNKNK